MYSAQIFWEGEMMFNWMKKLFKKKDVTQATGLLVNPQKTSPTLPRGIYLKTSPRYTPTKISPTPRVIVEDNRDDDIITALFALELASNIGSTTNTGYTPTFEGSGGQFSGAGASGTWDDSDVQSSSNFESSSSDSSSDSSSSSSSD
jgi:uncharacterized membrane protein YgcG